MRWQSDPVLTVDGLCMQFGGIRAVHDLSFAAGRGDITAIIGPNGAGKTTVFNCITGFYKPTSGRLAFAREGSADRGDIDTLTRSSQRHRRMANGDIYLLERMPGHDIAKRAKVARTFQNIRLFSGMTVLENLIVAQHNTLMRASGLSVVGLLAPMFYRPREREAVERASYWLERINLIDRADDPAGDLPYGDQRRLEIARAMCIEPVLLCLDEPAAGLNPRESAELTRLLRGIRDEHNVSILIIEHDMSVIMNISDHLVVLDHGVKISDGAPASVREDPKVIAAYLGTDEESGDHGGSSS